MNEHWGFKQGSQEEQDRLDALEATLGPVVSTNRPAMTMSEINRELGIPKANQGVTGNPNMAGYDHRPTHTCLECGGTGTEPTHRRSCSRYVWRKLADDPAARTLRDTLPRYRAAQIELLALPIGAPAAKLNALKARIGEARCEIIGAAASLLGEIDRNAGRAGAA